MKDVGDDAAHLRIFVGKAAAQSVVEIGTSREAQLTQDLLERMVGSQGIDQIRLLPGRQLERGDALIFFSSSFALFRMLCPRRSFCTRTCSCSSSRDNTPRSAPDGRVCFFDIHMDGVSPSSRVCQLYSVVLITPTDFAASRPVPLRIFSAITACCFPGRVWATGGLSPTTVFRRSGRSSWIHPFKVSRPG